MRLSQEGRKRMKKIYHIIRTMGVTSKYRGYYFIAEAVLIAARNPGCPLMITKDIYPAVAQKFRVSPCNIEQGIRTAVNICWISNREAMEKIAGGPLAARPTNSDFIDMLAYYLSEDKAS